MAKTINSYVPDRGELTFVITIADAAALPADYDNVADEDVILDGVVRKLEETTPKTKEYSETFVTAESDPIKTISSKVNATVWALTIIDDYTKGATGEWGTDTHAALEIFQDYSDINRTVSEIRISPAGSTAGMIETTLTNVDIQTIPHPMIDADATKPNEVTITLVVESFTKAAHA